MPLDIVGQIADVDATVLLRLSADVGHHLFLAGGTILKAARLSRRSRTSGVRVAVGRGCGAAVTQGRARAPVAAPVLVSRAARSAARGIGTTTRASGPATSRARPFALDRPMTVSRSVHCDGTGESWETMRLRAMLQAGEMKGSGGKMKMKKTIVCE